MHPNPKLSPRPKGEGSRRGMGVDVSLLSGFAIHDPSLEPTATDHPDGKMACGHRFEAMAQARRLHLVRAAGRRQRDGES